MTKAMILVQTGLILCAMLGGCKYKRKSKGISTTKTSLKIFHRAVNEFKADTGRFPTEEEGLEVLIQQPKGVTNWRPGGYIEAAELPKDQWGNDYIYKISPGDDRPFVIKSLGADGKDGGTGNDADLLSTDAF